MCMRMRLARFAPIIFAGYMPRNYNQGFMGAVSATDALNLSLNIPAVKLNLMLEGDGLYEMLSSVHLAEFSKNYYGAGIALGSISMSLMDLARLYSAFANGEVCFETVKHLGGPCLASRGHPVAGFHTYGGWGRR